MPGSIPFTGVADNVGAELITDKYLFDPAAAVNEPMITVLLGARVSAVGGCGGLTQPGKGFVAILFCNGFN